MTPVEAVCPACEGSTRRPCPEEWRNYRIAGYRESDQTLPCDNCGGQTMSGRATGRTRIDPATGLGCKHFYRGVTTRNCYHEYTCTKCGHFFAIDSGD